MQVGSPWLRGPCGSPRAEGLYRARWSEAAGHAATDPRRDRSRARPADRGGVGCRRPRRPGPPRARPHPRGPGASQPSTSSSPASSCTASARRASPRPRMRCGSPTTSSRPSTAWTRAPWPRGSWWSPRSNGRRPSPRGASPVPTLDTLHVAYYENEPYLKDNPWIDPSWEVRYRDRALIHQLRVHHDPEARRAWSTGHRVQMHYYVDLEPDADVEAAARRPVADEPAHREPAPAHGGGGADRAAVRARRGGRPTGRRVHDPAGRCRHAADPGLAGDPGGVRHQAPAHRRRPRRRPGAEPRDGRALPDR